MLFILLAGTLILRRGSELTQVEVGDIPRGLTVLEFVLAWDAKGRGKG